MAMLHQVDRDREMIATKSIPHNTAERTISYTISHTSCGHGGPRPIWRDKTISKYESQKVRFQLEKKTGKGRMTGEVETWRACSLCSRSTKISIKRHPSDHYQSSSNQIPVSLQVTSAWQVRQAPERVTDSVNYLPIPSLMLMSRQLGLVRKARMSVCVRCGGPSCTQWFRHTLTAA